MRELNTVELNEVSGAGFIADAAEALGRSIGAIVESGTKGKAGDADRGASLGSSIGQVIEAGISTIGGLFGGLFGKKK